MSSKNYLSTFGFNWDPLCCLPPLETLQKGSNESKAFHQSTRAVHNTLDKFSPLSLHFLCALRREKPILVNPLIKRSEIILTNDPRPDPYFTPKANLYVDVNSDPLSLRNLPNDIIGKLAADLAKDGLNKLASWPNFPVEILFDAIKEYEEAGYSYTWVIKDSRIPSTKARGKVIGKMSAEKTTVTAEITVSDTNIFRRQIWQAEGACWYQASHFARFTLEGDQLIIGDRSPFALAVAVPLELSDLPQPILTRKKNPSD